MTSVTWSWKDKGGHHGSHTPTSPEAILLGKMAHHTKQIRRECIPKLFYHCFRMEYLRSFKKKLSQILFLISGPTSSEWYWRIIDAIPKLSVTVNPNWLWKKEAYEPKKVVVTYYSTYYYLSETHYWNYYQKL